ncbi:MAG: hypothetical protein FWE90_00695 [Defluviitaleaceae bacterium]|nr:hypothetical protein [Defluviitaleaceae bacterium]
MKQAVPRLPGHYTSHRNVNKPTNRHFPTGQKDLFFQYVLCENDVDFFAKTDIIKTGHGENRDLWWRTAASGKLHDLFCYGIRAAVLVRDWAALFVTLHRTASAEEGQNQRLTIAGFMFREIYFELCSAYCRIML